MFSRLANWLDNSPTKKVLVASAAILAFLLSLLNGGWTVWKEYRALKKIPTIQIISRTSYSISAPVAIEQVLGTFAGSARRRQSRSYAVLSGHCRGVQPRQPKNFSVTLRAHVGVLPASRYTRVNGLYVTSNIEIEFV